MSRPAHIAVVAICVGIATAACGSTASPSASPASPSAATPSITSQPASTPPSVSSITPSPSTASASEAVVTLHANDAHQVLDAGAYRVDGFAVPFAVTIDDGWVFDGYRRNDFALRNDRAFLALVIVASVYPDPCHTEKPPTPVAPGVDALVTAFSAMHGFRVTGIEDAIVGGAHGKSLTLGNSIDLQSSRCASPDVLWIGRNPDDAPILETPGSSDLLWIVDVSGTTVLVGGPAEVVQAISFAGAPG